MEPEIFGKSPKIEKKIDDKCDPHLTRKNLRVTNGCIVMCTNTLIRFNPHHIHIGT